MASIYLGLQTDGEFFICSSMFAYEEKKVLTITPTKSKQRVRIHLLLLTTISFKASFDSTFSHVQIIQKIIKPENVFTITITHQKYAKDPSILFKFVSSYNYLSKAAHSKNFMTN